MAIENLQEVQNYLTTNNVEGNEVKTYLDGFKVQPTLENFKTKLNDADFRSFMDTEKDNHFNKANATWQTNNLDRLYQERFVKENPLADPKDIEIKKMKAMIEQIQNDGNKKDLTNKAFKLAEQMELPTSLVDFFVSTDEVTTVKNLEVLGNVFKAHVEKLVSEKLKGSTPKTGSGKAEGTTKEDFNKMPYKERMNLYNENPELYKELNK